MQFQEQRLFVFIHVADDIRSILGSVLNFADENLGLVPLLRARGLKNLLGLETAHSKWTAA